MAEVRACVVGMAGASKVAAEPGTAAAFARLDAKGQEALAADLEAAWAQFNRSHGDETVVPVEYLEVVATKA